MKLCSVIVFVLAIFSNLNACALCALYSPTAHANIKFISQNMALKEIKIQWIFSENFTKLTFETYDINSNLKLEDAELKEIKKALLDYLKPRSYLISASYYDGSQKDISLKLDPKDVRVLVQNLRLKFEFDFSLNLELKDKRVVKITIFDPEDYFNFKIASGEFYELEDGFFIKPNVNLNTGFYEITTKAPPKPLLHQLVPNEQQLNEQKFEIDKIDESKTNFISMLGVKYLGELKSLIKNGGDIHFILLISFIYGLLHAAGPGHGKLLTTSYFAANGGSYVKAFLFALKIGFLHVIGALVLVYATMFLVESFVSKTVNEVAGVTTKISAILIVLVACAMLVAKFKKNKFKFSPSGSSSRILNSSCACSCPKCSCKKDGEWFVVLGASLVPCPGVVLVFILAFSIGSFGAAFLSALMIGLAMAIVIFLAAVFGRALNLGFSKFKPVGFYFEILALCLMIMLGVFMFIASQRIQVL